LTSCHGDQLKKRTRRRCLLAYCEVFALRIYGGGGDDGGRRKKKRRRRKRRRSGCLKRRGVAVSWIVLASNGT